VIANADHFLPVKRMSRLEAAAVMDDLRGQRIRYVYPVETHVLKTTAKRVGNLVFTLTVNAENFARDLKRATKAAESFSQLIENSFPDIGEDNEP